MSRTILRTCTTAIIAILAACLGSAANAQIATLDKGHRIIVDNGLQIWGSATDIANYDVDYNALTGANMNGVIWGFPAAGTNGANGGTDIQVLSPGQKWGKWTDWQYNPGAGITPHTALTPAENARKADLIAVQVGDEANQSDMESGTQTRDWLLAAGNGTATTADDVFPNSLLYVNSFFIGNHAGYANFLTSGNPDAISWDSYPFANPHGHYITPRNWLSLGNTFRRHGLGSYIGATNTSPRPYGMFVQTFNDTFAVDPGEVQIRWQQFAAWTMGYKFVDAFIFSGGNNNFGNNPAGPVYQAFKETARQGQNLGPALSKLISYGYGPSFVQGAGTMGIPGDWLAFDRSNAPPSQRYLTGVSNVTNLGTKNGGLSGDVFVGFFNPLHRSFGDPVGTAYFMVMNGLGGDLTLPSGQSDNTATVAQTRQRMTLNFDFGVTGIDSLARLNRSTGAVEIINTSYNDGGNTIFTALGNGKYQLLLTLDGGTGDLFKYNDGTPFVGIEPALPLGYWDADAIAANNDVASGAGLGGSGTWNSATRWFNGATNTSYAANSNVVFTGAGGTVTLDTPQSVSSLEFKSDGYTINGSTLSLTAPTITVDAGATATIRSLLAGSKGLIKNGPGTLVLTRAGAYSGATTIHEGVLAIDTTDGDITMSGVIGGTGITKIGTGTLTLAANNVHASTVVTGGALAVASDTALGGAPTSFAPGNITLDGGTLRFGGNFDIHNNRGITIGAAGGTIDTQGFSNPLGYAAFQGGFRGPGDLTKVGQGTFFAAATTGGANVNWKGRLIIKEGTWKIVASDGLPYNAPAGDGLQPDQVTLDGGTWQIGATMNVTNGRRGVTIAAGGGTIDTQTFNLTWAGPWAGNASSAVVNKTGSGTLRLNSTTTYGPATYSGKFIVNDGTLQLHGGTAMGDFAAIELANVTSAALSISGSSVPAETIGSLAGGGPSGGNVDNAIGLVVGGNHQSTTYSGQISGAGTFTKLGNGTLTLDRPAGNTYAGTTTITGGTLRVNNTSGSGTGTGPVIVSAGGTLAGSGTIAGQVTVLNGGRVAPGSSIESLDVGSLTLAPSFHLDFELSTVAGVDVSDLLRVNNTNGLLITGGGTLNIIDAGNMTGGTYTLIDYAGTLGGSLSNFTLGAAPTGYQYSLVNNLANTSIDLVVSIPGDHNLDGSVDAADYVYWRKNIGTPAAYNLWRANFGRTTSASGFSSAVPEPAAIALLLNGAILALFRIR